MIFTAHCDGGSRGNPGPAGFGAVIENEDGKVVARLSQYLGIQTNNFAEYAGLVAVLHYALTQKIMRLKVVSDSQVMVRQMRGEYKVNSPTLKQMWVEATRLAAKLVQFELTHTLREGNKEADLLANAAMDRTRGDQAEPCPLLHSDPGTGAADLKHATAQIPACPPSDRISNREYSTAKSYAQPAFTTEKSVLVVDTAGNPVAMAVSAEWAEKIATALSLRGLQPDELLNLQGFKKAFEDR
jgi:ribonuclease HI